LLILQDVVVDKVLCNLVPIDIGKESPSIVLNQVAILRSVGVVTREDAIFSVRLELQRDCVNVRFNIVNAIKFVRNYAIKDFEVDSPCSVVRPTIVCSARHENFSLNVAHLY